MSTSRDLQLGHSTSQPASQPAAVQGSWVLFICLGGSSATNQCAEHCHRLMHCPTCLVCCSAWDGSLKMGLLPVTQFCSGYTYFVRVGEAGEERRETFGHRGGLWFMASAAPHAALAAKS